MISMITISINQVFSRLQNILLTRALREICYKMDQIRLWDPLGTMFTNSNTEKYGILILNTPIAIKPNILLSFWNKDTIRITVDGGTNQWLSWLTQNNISMSKSSFPHVISGDFDSLCSSVLSKLTICKEVQVVHTPDQDQTDFTKALLELKKFEITKDTKVNSIFVIVESSGRFDHIMANINTLHQVKDLFLENKAVFLWASDSITWLLEAGSHRILIPFALREKHGWCGIISFGELATVTTRGLKWNLTNGKLQWGGMQSTSNTYDGTAEVYIETDLPVIWTMDIRPLMEAKE